VLQVRDHAPTFFLFYYFTLRPVFGSLKEFGGASLMESLGDLKKINMWFF